MTNVDRIKSPWLLIQSGAEGSPQVEGTACAVFGHQLPAAGRGRPSGVYAEWNWDGSTLTVRNDRAGMGQLLYAIIDNGRGIGLSPHVEQLMELGADPEIDDGAMSVLIRLGFLLEQDTPFRSIRALPPNCTLTWQPGHLTVSGGAVVPAEAPVTRNEAIDRYVELFRQAMQRRPIISDSAVLPLTGGNDSRHILFELCRRGTPPQLCVTVCRYPKQTNDDAKVAAEIASHLGVRHETISATRSFVAEDFRKCCRLGPISDEGSWVSVLRDQIGGFSCSYDGIGGDVLALERLGGRPYDEVLHNLVKRREWNALANVIIDQYSTTEEALMPLIKQASFHDHGRRYVRDRIVAQLEQFEDSPHPLSMFLMNSRTRREIAMMSWLLCSDVNPYYAPYLDEDLFDFLGALPAAEFSSGMGFHRQVIAHGYPEWAHLPYLQQREPKTLPMSAKDIVTSILELQMWTVRNLPNLFPTVAAWASHRLLTRAGRHSAPRRVVQHWLVLEQMFRRFR